MLDFSSSENITAAKEKAAYYCAQQEHCIFDVRKKLFQWGVAISYHDAIIEYLLEYDFINETRYANSFCVGKFHQNKWGRKKISYSLMQKGIGQEIIQQGLLSIAQEEYRDVLLKILIQKVKTVKGANVFERKQKVIKSLISKGFESHLIIELIEDKLIFEKE